MVKVAAVQLVAVLADVVLRPGQNRQGGLGDRA
ncbi:MAG: hypothetical protein QOI21_426 [Actinomycetota bacterium]|jgi:hypothetical protein|nr:hypothetical protein [Actinomycetota bacterium]